MNYKTLTSAEAERLKWDMLDMRRVAHATLIKHSPTKATFSNSFKFCQWAEKELYKANQIEGRIYFYLNPSEWTGNSDHSAWLIKYNGFIPCKQSLK